MNHKILVIIGLCAAIGFFLWRVGVLGYSQEIIQQDHSFSALLVGDNKLRVEIVTTPESTRLGLSGRDELGSDGMLFVFPSRRVIAFWMKEMEFDIDIIWIAGNRVVQISKNIPHPPFDLPQQELKLYSPRLPVDRVLEVEAGKSSQWGIEVGNKVTF